MGLTETFIRILGSGIKSHRPKEDFTFKPRHGFEDMHTFLTDKNTEAKPKPQR